MKITPFALVARFGTAAWSARPLSKPRSARIATRTLIANTVVRSVLLLLTAIVNSQFSNAVAQGTAFTYQGRLDNGAVPASDTYDFEFYLRDALTGGNSVSSTNSIAAV